jgi:hypothetical protein
VMYLSDMDRPLPNAPEEQRDTPHPSVDKMVETTKSTTLGRHNSQPG